MDHILCLILKIILNISYKKHAEKTGNLSIRITYVFKKESHSKLKQDIILNFKKIIGSIRNKITTY